MARRVSVYTRRMRAHVYVTLKSTVLDAQGQTIANALRRLHHPSVKDVRQGKYFALTLDDSLPPDANPVIEDFTYRIE